jgi:N-acetylglucosaminyldiphosphoundecaprenol N-acetyl-beta-D-mannosaminyltransferase
LASSEPITAAATPPDQTDVLGTPLAVVDYDGAVAETLRLAQLSRPSAIAAANTHLLAQARWSHGFRRVLSQFNLILPDGMPLVWSMRRQGAAINDRVYGPYFMRHVLEQTPRPWKHFFFGGTEQTLQELSTAARLIQPNLDVAGVFSPPFRSWDERDHEYFAYKINLAEPNFIWVALGGGRQEEWIMQNQFRFDRGVFIAIGDAFSLLAGQRAFAPAWMQKAGLTWLYRLKQEPRRLTGRYLKYNSLYIYYSFRDRLLGSPKT